MRGHSLSITQQRIFKAYDTEKEGQNQAVIQHVRKRTQMFLLGFQNTKNTKDTQYSLERILVRKGEEAKRPIKRQ